MNLLGNELVLVAPKDFDGGDHDRSRISTSPSCSATARSRWRRQGRAGRQIRQGGAQKLGVWAAVAGKVAQAENVRAALALVSRGEAPLGIVYQTDANAESEGEVVGTFPEDSHPPIIYPVALTGRFDERRTRPPS